MGRLEGNKTSDMYIHYYEWGGRGQILPPSNFRSLHNYAPAYKKL